MITYSGEELKFSEMGGGKTRPVFRSEIERAVNIEKKQNYALRPDLARVR